MNGLHHAEADQVSWIIPPFKTYFELPQHLECIPHGYVQFVTDVTQRHAPPDVRTVSFMRDHDGAAYFRVCRQPSVSRCRKLRLGFASKLRVPLNPRHHVYEYIGHRRLCRRNEQPRRPILHPLRQSIAPPQQLATHSVDAQQPLSRAVVTQAFPETRAQVHTIVAPMCFDEDVRVEREHAVLHVDRSNARMKVANVSPRRPVRAYASRYVRRPSLTARLTAAPKRRPMRTF